MNNLVQTALILSCLAMACPPGSQAADDPRDPLLGVWLAQSMEADGKQAPAEAIEQMRFTFQEDKLLIRGNTRDGQEDECKYQLDPSQTPKQLDFTPPAQKKPLLAIYEVEGDKLTVCIRHASSSQGRPTEFATKADSKLVLIVFKRQQP